MFDHVNYSRKTLTMFYKFMYDSTYMSIHLLYFSYNLRKLSHLATLSHCVTETPMLYTVAESFVWLSAMQH